MTKFSTTSPWLKELQRKFEGGAKAQQEVRNPEGLGRWRALFGSCRQQQAA